MASPNNSPGCGSRHIQGNISIHAAAEGEMTPAQLGSVYNIETNGHGDVLHSSRDMVPAATDPVLPSFPLSTRGDPPVIQSRADASSSTSDSNDASSQLEVTAAPVTLDPSSFSVIKVLKVEQGVEADTLPESQQATEVEQNAFTPPTPETNHQVEMSVTPSLSSEDAALSNSLLYQEDGKPLPVASEILDESAMWTETKSGAASSFQCNSCPYTCGYKSRIKQHMRSVHSTLKPYKCHLCEHSTAVRASLTKHINAVHRKLKPFSCSLCSYTCSLKSSLEVHLSGFHSKQYRHSCPHCTYAASSRNVLDIHVQAVHMKAKPYKCPHCDYSSGYPQYIPKHIAAVHERQKPFACPHCPYRSSYKTYLQKHCDAVHRNIKPYSCPHCPYTTSYSQYLSTHISAVHNDEKPHKCPHCNFRCAYKQYISKHVELVHSGKGLEENGEEKVGVFNGDASPLSITSVLPGDVPLDQSRPGEAHQVTYVSSNMTCRTALLNEAEATTERLKQPSASCSEQIKSVWPEMQGS